MQYFYLLACNRYGLFAIYKSIALQNDLFSNKFFFRLDDYQIADIAFALFVRTQNNKKKGETRSLPKALREISIPSAFK